MTSKELIQAHINFLEQTMEHDKVLQPSLVNDDILEIETYKKVLKDLEEKEKQDKILETLRMPMLYSKRKKLGEEYIEWAKENNVNHTDLTNIITWCFCFKMKEVLDNGNTL